MWRAIFLTIRQLIVSSPAAWREIVREGRHIDDFNGRFLHPVVGVVALTSFIGGLWFAGEGGLQGALKSAIISIVAVYGGFYIISYTLNEAAPRFGLNKNQARFQQFTGYGSVVVYVLNMIIPFLPGFFILWLLSLYSVYIVQAGAVYYLKVPADKRLNFTILASALIILVPALIRGLFTILIT